MCGGDIPPVRQVPCPNLVAVHVVGVDAVEGGQHPRLHSLPRGQQGLQCGRGRGGLVGVAHHREGAPHNVRPVEANGKQVEACTGHVVGHLVRAVAPVHPGAGPHRGATQGQRQIQGHTPKGHPGSSSCRTPSPGHAAPCPATMRVGAVQGQPLLRAESAVGGAKGESEAGRQHRGVGAVGVHHQCVPLCLVHHVAHLESTIPAVRDGQEGGHRGTPQVRNDQAELGTRTQRRGLSKRSRERMEKVFTRPAMPHVYPCPVDVVRMGSTAAASTPN